MLVRAGPGPRKGPVVTDRTCVVARATDALAEVYASGREPGGALRWREAQSWYERPAARERARVAGALRCRVHPDRADCQPINLANYRRAPEAAVSRCP